jgi:hypothetical protein
MPSQTPSELKKLLIAAGLEIFRVQGSRVHLADRVRENLIMDSGVAAVAGDALGVRLVTRAQASHFPSEAEAQLFGRARQMGNAAIARGYCEVETLVVPVKDPGGGPHTLDTWYEVAYEKTVAEGDLIGELRLALGLDKTACPD